MGNMDCNPDPSLINPLPLQGIIRGILILRPLKGGGLLIMGLHELIHEGSFQDWGLFLAAPQFHS